MKTTDQDPLAQIELSNAGSAVVRPDRSAPVQTGCALGIVAHPDDLEIATFHGILRGRTPGHPGFVGVVVTHGGGSPRSGRFAEVSDTSMQAMRREEQLRAATRGGYCAIIFLDYDSAAVKGAGRAGLEEDLRQIMEALAPETVYTHSLADRHDTHVAVATATIQAARKANCSSMRLLGCEVWGDLDWLPDAVALDVGGEEELARDLIAVFESQVEGGKDYVSATLGRRKAQATFSQSHQVDSVSEVILAMDLSPLLRDPTASLADFVQAKLDAFSERTRERLLSMGAE